MKGLKLMIAGCMLAIAGSTMAEDYNRAGLTYNLGHYNFNKNYEEEANFKGFCTNGFGLNYVHGFGLSESLPMFLEVGGELNFNFSNKKVYEGTDEIFDYEYNIKENSLFQNINLNVPVNFTWHFAITDDITVAPYTGFSFKLHMMSRVKNKTEIKGLPTDVLDDYFGEDEDKWQSVFGSEYKKEWGKTWNRFQMGWQLGANAIYQNKYTVGLEYGYDMIPAFSCKEDLDDFRITNGTFKITLGYIF